MHCKRCQSEVDSNYCPDCGLPTQLKRINWHYIVHDVSHVLHLETGIFSTFWQLLKAPGATIREFISEDRTKIVKPVLFLILTSLLYTLLQQISQVEDGYIQVNTDKGKAVPYYLGHMFDWVKSHYGYANLLMSGFIAMWLLTFFRKAPYNFFELLVLLCYVMGVGMSFFFVFTLLEWITGISSLNQGTAVSILYSTYAIGQFYNRRGFKTYFKAFWAYFLGFLMFSILVAGIGLALDYQAGNLDQLKKSPPATKQAPRAKSGA